MKNDRLTVEEVVNQGTLEYNVSKTYLFVKKLGDMTISLLGIIILLPLFIAVAVAIKWDSYGPVFFTQTRCSLKGKTFKIYKFRSMETDAERQHQELKYKNEVSGYMFKIKCDPRVTRVGKFIRKTSIDELPQLFNVLKGDMSLVGPRPSIIDEVENYESWHKLRLSAKPGLTGLWQISGRNSLGFEEMIRLDLKYVRERSLLYDLKIILKTIPLLFGDKNAF